ncbi:hypothetical protein AU210_016293 [Fusarium oxysporum f. sp. radicis-cucumerinum]|uniref:Uncharacterized protein n=1 Tax=Fusarium oxysporum f. sp. radicis-cucumerinum TaxID=327505 RepID=A0A2H3FNR2_FUSOX|nr:hypothetical protein AU210_016293 [Fusarium oxysporum f. sp. radicis-cucumerinum]
MSTAVAIDDVSHYFDEHGFLYRPLKRVGTMVQNLYDDERLRDPTANFDFFKPILESDPVLRKLLEGYPVTVLEINWPWGKFDEYYCWGRSSPFVFKPSLAIYVLAPGSKATCCDRSHKREVKGLSRHPNGTLPLSNESMEPYEKKDIESEFGGVLCVHPLLGHKIPNGVSKFFTVRKK